MKNGDIDHCRNMIAKEVALGFRSMSPEAGDAHFQLAMLYRAQLASLERMSRIEQ